MNARDKHTLKSRLLKEYKILYKKDPTEFYGACKISKRLNLSEKEHGAKYWKTHGLLLELKKDGFLEQSPNGKGFRYKP